MSFFYLFAKRKHHCVDLKKCADQLEENEYVLASSTLRDSLTGNSIFPGFSISVPMFFF